MLLSTMAKLRSAKVGSHREIAGDYMFSLQRSTWENIDRLTGGWSVIDRGNGNVVDVFMFLVKQERFFLDFTSVQEQDK